MPLPLDVDTWLVSERVAVVARRDVEDVFWAELELCAIGEIDPEPSREDESHMPSLAPFAPDLWSDMGRPAPARLGDELADREVAELHDCAP